jgi:hypothetical protein
MDVRLKGILDSLLRNVEVLNSEMLRMVRTDQFSDADQCFHLLERVRGSCMYTMENLRTIECRLYARELAPPPEEKECPVEY